MPRTPQPVPTTPPYAPDGELLPLPHERDEAVGQVEPSPDPVIAQAARDLQAGQVDTDMRATPGLDAERRERMVPTPQPPGSPVRARPTTGRGKPRR